MIVLYIYFAPTRSLEPSPRSLPKGRPKVRQLQQGSKKIYYNMIKVSDFKFVIETNTTSYCFRKLNSGQLEHLYYGEKMDAFDGAFEALCPVNKYPAGNLCTYSKDFPDVALENMCLEYSGYGKGDVREPLVVIRNTDGSLTSDFIYHSYVINRGKHIESINGMPSALKPDEQLKIKLMDRQTNVELDLYYNIFEESDCITRFSKVVNHEDSPIEIVRLLSNQRAVLNL